jgi:hypothetical protein
MTGKVDQASLQSALYKVGYFVFLAVLIMVVLLSLRVALLQRDQVQSSHLTVSSDDFPASRSTHVCQRVRADHSQIVRWLLLASPFLALRTAYGMLGIFNATGDRMFTSMWSSLFGSATTFSLMALLPEFIIVCIYIQILRSRVKTCRDMNLLLGEDHDAGAHEMNGYQKARVGP